LYSYEWKKVFNPGEAEDFFENAPSRAFEPQTINFSQTNAWWLSEFSRLIYARGQEGADETVVRNRFLHGLGLTEHWFFNGKYLQCAIITANPKKNTPFSVLVFRGTAGTITNWLYNLNATLSPCHPGPQEEKSTRVLNNFFLKHGKKLKDISKHYMDLFTILDIAWVAPLQYFAPLFTSPTRSTPSVLLE
jgi:hypothetical protein